MEMVRKLNEDGHTIVFITHDMSLVAHYASRVIVLCRGKVLVDSDVRSVFSRPELLKETYLSPPQITALAQSLGRHAIPPGVLSVEEMHQLLTTIGGEQLGCCR
jgi:energy-coupling factor transport system ATP-binding protein